ncbi:hypothetical protein [Streptomyces sp. NPDC057115]|uniref:hypothetical protein n=1 Tax=Streptomyces sp. NPDC057115 TaxID=3346022 RepID=UPI00362545AA
MIRRLFRRRGGSMPAYRPAADEQLVTLSPGGPDCDRIARLERELGIGNVEPERPIRRAPSVCLTKGCAGDTEEIRTWSGVLAMRIHECEAP